MSHYFTDYYQFDEFAKYSENFPEHMNALYDIRLNKMWEKRLMSTFEDAKMKEMYVVNGVHCN